MGSDAGKHSDVACSPYILDHGILCLWNKGSILAAVKEHTGHVAPGFVSAWTLVN